MKRFIIIACLLIAIPAFARMMGGTMGSLIGAGVTVTDHFTYADGELATVSTNEFVRWDTHVNAGVFNVDTGKLKLASGSATGHYLHKTTFLSANVYSQIKLDTIAAGMDVALYVNAQDQGSATADGYLCNVWDDGGTKTIEISEMVDGNWGVPVTSDTTTSYAAGDVFRFANESGTLKTYKNGVLISGLNYTDATYTAARVGFSITGVTDARFDDWEGGDVR